MRIVKKIAFIYLVVMMAGVLSSLLPPPPPGVTCPEHCESLVVDGVPDGGSAYQECLVECESYGVSIDTNIFLLLVAGTILASFVLLRKPNHKETPR